MLIQLIARDLFFDETVKRFVTLAGGHAFDDGQFLYYGSAHDVYALEKAHTRWLAEGNQDDEGEAKNGPVRMYRADIVETADERIDPADEKPATTADDWLQQRLDEVGQNHERYADAVGAAQAIMEQTTAIMEHFPLNSLSGLAKGAGNGGVANASGDEVKALDVLTHEFLLEGLSEGKQPHARGVFYIGFLSDAFELILYKNLLPVQHHHSALYLVSDIGISG